MSLNTEEDDSVCLSSEQGPGCILMLEAFVMALCHHHQGGTGWCSPIMQAF